MDGDIEVVGNDKPMRLPEPASVAALGAEDDRIVEYVRQHGSIGNGECRALLGVDRNRATYLLTRLVRTGTLTTNGKSGRWLRYSAP